MNKKLKTRLLIGIGSILWGIVIYRFVQNHKAKDALEETEMVYNNTNFSPIMFNKDSFELILPAVDPFLKKQASYKSNNNYNGQSTSNQSTSNQRKIKKKVVPKEVKKELPWPTIKYMGFVKNRDQDKTLCLLQINGRTTQISKGEEMASVHVSNVYRDSVHLVFGGEERTFLK